MLLSLDEYQGGRELDTFGVRASPVSIFRTLPVIEPPAGGWAPPSAPVPSPWTPAPTSPAFPIVHTPAAPAPLPKPSPAILEQIRRSGADAVLRPLDTSPTSPSVQPIVRPRELMRTADFQDRNGDGIDDRDQTLTATMTPVERVGAGRTAVVIAGVVLLLLIVAIAATS